MRETITIYLVALLFVLGCKDDSINKRSLSKPENRQLSEDESKGEASGNKKDEVSEKEKSGDATNPSPVSIPEKKENEGIKLLLKDVMPQNDEWSCGINSSARILKSYGYDVEYESLKVQLGPFDIKEIIPELQIDMPMGYPPKKLQFLLQEIVGDKGTVRLKEKLTEDESLKFVETLIKQRKPVIVLMGLGIDEYEYLGTMVGYPILHWIVINGITDDSFWYYDTEGTEENGGDQNVSAKISFRMFEDQFLAWSGWSFKVL